MSSDNLTRDEARRRAELLSDVTYDVELDLSGDGPTFTSTTRVRFRCAEPGAASFLDLTADGVRSATLNGRALDISAFDGVRLPLDDLAADNEVEVVADCRYQRTGVGLHRFVDPADDNVYLHTQFEPFDAHRVYACFDQPDIKAPWALQVHAPSGWVVVSNGEVTDRPDEGAAGTWRFVPTPPVSTYITALVAGPFRGVFDRHQPATGPAIDLGIYCRRSLAEHLDPDEIFEITKQGFDFFTAAFDYPYPFGKYDQLFVPEFNFGAMENPGCVTFSESYVFRSKVTDAARESRAGTILHEMAHMWFGDLVTMRWWDDLWLNESFATYMGTLGVAEATRFRTAWAEFATSLKAWAVNQDQLPSTHPVAADMPDTRSVRTNFDGITYAKGASVLKQLVAWVSRDAFLEGLKGYFPRHAFGNATLADFLSALEGSSGRELADWSKSWLETTGVNTLRAELEVAGDGTFSSVAVLQEAAEAHPTLRAHRVAIGLYDRTGDGLVRRRQVELDVEGARTEVHALVGDPQPDLLLLNDDDHTYAKIRLDERSITTLVERLGGLSDPLTRALCWGAAWDMTRDAELPARRFVRLVTEHAAAETEVNVLSNLLAQAQAAIDRYGDPANRPAARALVARTARAELERVAAGSDLQLLWLRTLASLVDDEADLDWLEALLEGEAAVDGLDIDTELRWHLLSRLVVHGRADDAAIDDELARDNTDMGARRAAAARASRPTAEAKRAAWTRLLGQDDPLALKRVVAAGLHQPAQEELLAPYVEPWLEALPGIWDGDPVIEEALVLTGGLYPQTLIDERTLRAADQALADGALPGPGRRVVLEARDATRRALRTRRVDADAARDPARPA